ncbi:hypothetical protein Tco_1369866 [Tanacetum coccineum]
MYEGLEGGTIVSQSFPSLISVSRDKRGGLELREFATLWLSMERLGGITITWKGGIGGGMGGGMEVLFGTNNFGLKGLLYTVQNEFDALNEASNGGGKRCAVADFRYANAK